MATSPITRTVVATAATLPVAALVLTASTATAAQVASVLGDSPDVARARIRRVQLAGAAVIAGVGLAGSVVSGSPAPLVAGLAAGLAVAWALDHLALGPVAAPSSRPAGSPCRGCSGR